MDVQQTIPVRPPLCRCQDIEPPAAVARDVLMRRHDIRHGEKPPNLRAAFSFAERAVWSTRLDRHGNPEQDEDALYYAMLEVAVAAMAVMDHLNRPQT